MGRKIFAVKDMIRQAIFFWAIMLLLALTAPGYAHGADEGYRYDGQNELLARHLEAYDDTPLNSREPLVLIHGIAPWQGDYHNFENLVEAFAENKPLMARYKIYFFVYDPEKKVADSSRLLKAVIRELLDRTGADKVSAIGHSLGGLLYRDIILDPFIEAHTNKVIAIGTPFHGTPLANPGWMRGGLKKAPWYSLLRLTNRLVFGFTELKYPHFEEDYCWDNFDGALPAGLSDETDCNPHKYSPENTQAFIFYSSFSGVDDKLRKKLYARLGVPFTDKDRASALPLKEHWLFNKHRMLEMARRNMARLPFNPEYQTDDNPYLFAVNDGVAPLISLLWVGRYLPMISESLEMNERLWIALEAVRKSGQARLFPDHDHRDWMEGKTRREDTDKVRDLFHPGEKPRTVYQWMMHDLLRNEN